MGTRGGSECEIWEEGCSANTVPVPVRGGEGFVWESGICNSQLVDGNLSFWDGAVCGSGSVVWLGSELRRTEHEGCGVSFWGPSCGGADCFRLVQIGAGATSEPSQCGVASAESGVGEGSEWGVSGLEGAGLMTLEV
jgi:hypothetical protein